VREKQRDGRWNIGSEAGEGKRPWKP